MNLELMNAFDVFKKCVDSFQADIDDKCKKYAMALDSTANYE